MQYSSIILRLGGVPGDEANQVSGAYTISNAGTFGQQRSKAREGIYPGNASPIHVFELPPATA